MKNCLYMLIALCALSICLDGCSGDGSKESNPINVGSAVEESSSSDDDVSSSSGKASLGSLLFKDSSGSTEDSVSAKASSSSGKKKSSSSVASSSSGTKVSEPDDGPSDVPAKSSESGKSSESAKSSATSSSSSQSGSSQTSSSQASSSSSSGVQEPSSSSKAPEPADSSSSSKAESSSSVVQVIPSKLYDCNQFKCQPTQYLNPEIEYGELLDVRDNHVYRTVEIGDQVWMAQNLNYDTGDTTTDSRFVYRYSSDVVPNVEDSIAKYGRGYTWYQIIDSTECDTASCYFTVSDPPRRGFCPEGWHVPSEREWKLLEKFVDLNNEGESLGVSLKAKSLWEEHPNAPTGSDRFGFSALPFQPKMSSYYPLETAAFWTTGEVPGSTSCAYAHVFNYYYQFISKESYGKSQRIALRCLKD